MKDLNNKENGASLATLFNKKIWTVEDVAKVLDVSIGHIYNLKSKDDIPTRQVGKKGRLYFFPEEILDWLDLKGVQYEKSKN